MASSHQKKTIGSIETWEPDDKSFSKHMLTEGIGDVTPNDGAVCTVSVSFVDDIQLPEDAIGGYKVNEFIEVTIGEGDSILSELFDKVVCSMKENETCYIKSKVDITGNKVEDYLAKEKALKFNVILKSFSRAADITELESDEKLEKSQHHKDKGTELFKLNKLEFAVKRYLKATKFLEAVHVEDDLPESLKEQCQTLQVQCYNNLGACYLKQEKYMDVIQIVGRALDVDGKNVKALFRRGQAYGKMHKYSEAISDFEKALKHEPDNNAIKNQLRIIEALKKKEKDMYQKMFN